MNQIRGVGKRYQPISLPHQHIAVFSESITQMGGSNLPNSPCAQMDYCNKVPCNLYNTQTSD